VPPSSARAAWALAGVTIALEIPYPLVHGNARDVLTVATVLVFAAATCTHLLATGRVPWWFLGVTALVGFVAEAVGTHTGFPFGSYAYDGSLGPRALGVPVVIPLAWTMMAWPALAAARRLTTRGVPLVAGWALASWDLFLDPQMVAAHHWSWRHASPGLQGIPLTNYAGWLGVSVALMFLLDRLVPRPGDDTQPLALYLWTYGSSVLANVAFFGRPGIALSGGLGMGVVALPLAARLARR
jgi:uncharacterized membrane protein